jgi:DNA-binding SARP family transcriptional activator
MRRVFEPDYREGLSANYIQFDGDVVSLSGDLILTSSQECWRILKQTHVSPEDVERLVSLYNGKYALDFVYEDWAADYREGLHAAVLAAFESEARRSRLEGNFSRTISIAQAILAIDPAADALELELLMAYKASGRRAAAAEQYAHYASFMREELGSEPPPLDQL